MINTYFPGQGVRLIVRSLQLGVLALPVGGIVVTVTWPDATTVNPTVQTVAPPGAFYNVFADVQIPSGMTPGIAKYKWVATGTNPSQDAVEVGELQVLAG